MEKRKVIIDCDPGIDDSLAIMLALKSPEIEVVGITVVCGNSPVEMGFENAKKILKQMNRLDVPVFIGESTPLKRDYVNALDTHGEDGLGESGIKKPEQPGHMGKVRSRAKCLDIISEKFRFCNTFGDIFSYFFRFMRESRFSFNLIYKSGEKV